MIKFNINKIKQNENKKKYIDKILLNRPYIYFKNVYKPIMPLNIYQTWLTKDLPQAMRLRVERLKRQNPRFKHYLYDDEDCRQFIKNNFDTEVLNAYDRLIPGAYKADLWRLCVLYKWGGIYLDIKLNCINGFRLIELTEKNHYVKDRPPKSIFYSLMASAPGNNFLLKGITNNYSYFELFTNSSSDVITIPNGKFWSGTVNVLGIRQNGENCARYIRQVTIGNDSGDTSIYGTVATIGTDLHASKIIGLTTYFTDINIVANNIDNSLIITVRGLPSETMRWIASAEGVEMEF
jgi:hypothetical protein